MSDCKVRTITERLFRGEIIHIRAKCLCGWETVGDGPYLIYKEAEEHLNESAPLPSWTVTFYRSEQSYCTLNVEAKNLDDAEAIACDILDDPTQVLVFDEGEDTHYEVWNVEVHGG